MRSIEILQSEVGKNLSSIHARRRDALWRAVTGLIIGGKASLSALGRALPGETSEKHRIKAVDRLLGNEALHGEIEKIYRAIAYWLLKGVRNPIVAVDWTGSGAHHVELSAKICSDGRALPLYSLVFTKGEYVQWNAHREFLRGLASILPTGCKPIVITDAGYHPAWFSEVRRYNWHYIGRVRGQAHVTHNGQELTMQQVHRYAGTQPKELRDASLSAFPQGRLVLSARPHSKGRKRLTRKGKRGRNTVDHKASKSAREPWVLVTSLKTGAPFIVHAYSLRMQIEESFRDRKSYRNGWAMRLMVTRSPQRVAVMLLLASLAELAVQIVGRATVEQGRSFGFQANTTRKHRVLSFFFLGCRVCRTGVEQTASELRAALASLLNTIARNAQPFAAELPRAFPARRRPDPLSSYKRATL